MVTPVYVLAPERVRVPVPALVNPALAPPVITPEKLLLLESPAVKVVADPGVPSVIEPEPESEPIVSDRPLESNTPEPDIVTEDVSDIWLALRSLSVRALKI